MGKIAAALRAIATALQALDGRMVDAGEWIVHRIQAGTGARLVWIQLQLLTLSIALLASSVVADVYVKIRGGTSITILIGLCVIPLGSLLMLGAVALLYGQFPDRVEREYLLRLSSGARNKLRSGKAVYGRLFLLGWCLLVTAVDVTWQRSLSDRLFCLGCWAFLAYAISEACDTLPPHLRKKQAPDGAKRPIT
jgi:hypothetical protein